MAIRRIVERQSAIAHSFAGAFSRTESFRFATRVTTCRYSTTIAGQEAQPGCQTICATNSGKNSVDGKPNALDCYDW